MDKMIGLIQMRLMYTRSQSIPMHRCQNSAIFQSKSMLTSQLLARLPDNHSNEIRPSLISFVSRAVQCILRRSLSLRHCELLFTAVDVQQTSLYPQTFFICIRFACLVSKSSSANPKSKISIPKTQGLREIC